MDDYVEYMNVFEFELCGSILYLSLFEAQEYLRGMDQSEDTSEYKITMKRMKVEDFNKLPEFDGF